MSVRERRDGARESLLVTAGFSHRLESPRRRLLWSQSQQNQNALELRQRTRVALEQVGAHGEGWRGKKRAEFFLLLLLLLLLRRRRRVFFSSVVDGKMRARGIFFPFDSFDQRFNAPRR